MIIRLDSSLHVALVVLMASLWPPLATAQTAAVPPAKPVVPTATADAAPLPYRSALEGYQRYTEEKTVNWKEANDAVARIGGWREYAKEASQVQTPAGSTKLDSGAAPAKP